LVADVQKLETEANGCGYCIYIPLWKKRSTWNNQRDTRSRAHPCIYFGVRVIIFVYVDDIIIAGENDQIIERISDGFKSRFKMKDLGVPKRILGLDLIEVPEGIMLCGKSRSKIYSEGQICSTVDQCQLRWIRINLLCLTLTRLE
jgi:hypothetical protein